MMKKLVLIALSLMMVGCWAGHVEYQHLAQWMNERTQKEPFLFTEVRGEMTLNGMGYTIDGDACPGEYQVDTIKTFNFYAKFEQNKWTVTASRELMEDMSKDEAEQTFVWTMRSLIDQCEAEHRRRQSWNDKSSA